MIVFRQACYLVVLALCTAARAAAQTPQPPASGAGQTQTSESAVVINQKHYIRQGNVELHDPANKTDLYADLVEFFDDENRAVATGNIVLSQGANRISAERAEFNTKTMLGTFFNASGIATVQPPKQTQRPGMIAPPPLAGQDTVVYFFGETVEKIGPKKYKITKGGFTTCVQPTPRWDMTASTVILNLEHYTLLKNAVMTVKGVPMLYLPVLYYPTKKEDRATGFLIPTYGSSTLRGQSLHNAFFWAIDRSQDATIQHDYYSKIGQGVGGEYRYNWGVLADGSVRGFMLDQRAVTYVGSDGTAVPREADRYFDLTGSANQLLPGNIRARGRISYPSNIATSQAFNTNIYDLSRNQRTYGGNIVGAWGSYGLNATIDHSEYFYDENNSVTSGGWPRVAFSRNERPIGSSPLYLSLGTEYANLLRNSQSFDKTTNVKTEDNQSLSRLDFNPQIRYPFKKWAWLTANTTAGWRETFYSRILSPKDPTGAVPQTITDESFNRRVWNVQTQLVGPVFNRIWDTPENGYAEKFKHSIEPSLLIQKTSDVANPDRIAYFDGTDYVYGGTQITYALTNRFYAKRKLTPGTPAQAREIISVDIRQRYYTNQLAAATDPQFSSALIGGGRPSNYSPISLNIRAAPTNELTSSVTMDFDSHYHQLRTISANTMYSWSQQLQTTVGWSKKAFIAGLPGFDDNSLLDHFINASTTARTRDNRWGGTYSFNYDVLRSSMLQQQVTGFYNAQCCGLAFQYQTYSNPYGVLPADHRFFLSFTLAGLGNFSPFNGALSGVPR
jgi:LPS-assembly protein